MKSVELKEVAAIIDATGTVDRGRRVAIKYVNAQGDIRKMIISKRAGRRASRPALGELRNRKKPHYRDKALIPILDHSSEGQPKNIFLFGIIGFNPDPDLSKFYPIARYGTESQQ